MMNNNNSSPTTKRRKFLTMAVGTTLGFSIPYIYTNIENTNNLVRAGCPGCDYFFRVFICGAGVYLLAQFVPKRKSESAEFQFTIEYSPERKEKIDLKFEVWVAYQKNGRYFVDKRFLRDEINTTIYPNTEWEYSYSASVKSSDRPLYLSIGTDCRIYRTRFDSF